MSRFTTGKKIFLTIAGTIALFAAALFAAVQFFKEVDKGMTFVSGRPDLSEGCDESCLAWAEAHAADFVPIDKAQHLKVAIIQPSLAPSPESILIQFTLSDADRTRYLADKTQVQDSVRSFIENSSDPWFSQFNDAPFNKLNWWHPQTPKGVRVYKSRSGLNGDYLVVSDQATNRITVLGIASRGR